MGHRVDVREDVVEVNGIPAEQTEPFSQGKLQDWPVAVEQGRTCFFDVMREILKERVGFCNEGERSIDESRLRSSDSFHGNASKSRRVFLA